MNEPQERFAKARKGCAVSASAGTGKTKALTDRYVALITGAATGKPVDPSRILFVTFGRKAANELKKRLTDAAAAKLLDAEPETAKKIDASAALTPQVFTYHGFAKRVLAEHGAIEGYPPDFRILPQSEARRLRDRIALDAVNARIESGCDKSAELLAFRSAEEIRTELLNLLDDFARLSLGLESYAKDDKPPAPVPTAEDVSSALRSAALESARLDKKQAEIFADFLEVLLRGNPPPNGTAYSQLMDWLAGAKEELTAFCKSKETGFKRDFKTACLSSVKQAVSELAERASQPYVDYMLALANEIETAFIAEKKRLGAAEFSDLERLAVKIIAEPNRADVRARLASLYDFILVDEFQDTNRNQAKMITALTEEDECGAAAPALNMVGDPKQCIYNFRGANLESFLEFAKNSPERERFNQNYRSVKQILDYVNFAWGRICRRVYGENAEDFYGAEDELSVPFDESARKAPNEKLDGVFLYAPKNKISADEGRALGAKALVENVIKLKREGAIGDYADVCVLTRSRKGFPELAKQFEAAGIKAVFSSSEPDEGTETVKAELNAALQFLLSPSDQSALYALLCSPFCALPDACAAALLAGKEERGRFTDWMSGLTDDAPAPIGLSENEVERLLTFREATIAARKSLGRKSARKIIAGMIDQAGYIKRLSALPDREGRLSAAREWLSKAERLGRDGQNAALVLSKMKGETSAGEDEDDFDPPQAAPDAVNVMTVHKAKGLQWDVVCLFGLPVKKGGNAARWATFSPAGGAAVKPPLGLEGKIWKEAVEAQIIEEYKEEARIIYVALTRAKRRLEIYFSEGALEEKRQKKDDDDSRSSVFNWNKAFYETADARLACEADLCRIEEIEASPEDENADEKSSALPFPSPLSFETDVKEAVKLATAQPSDDRLIPRLAARNALAAATCPRMTKLLFARSRCSPIEAGSNLEPFRQRALAMRDESEIKGVVAGEFFHLLMERLDFGSDEPAPEAINERLLSFGLPKRFLNCPAVNALKKDCARLWRDARFKQIFAGSAVLRETPFELLCETAAGRLIITGRMDAAALKDDAATIVDYKYGDADESSMEIYLCQLALYRRALIKRAEAEGARLEVNAALCFPSRREPFVFLPPQGSKESEEIESKLDDALALARNAASGRSLPPRVNLETCDSATCSFRPFCYPFSRSPQTPETGDESDEPRI